MNNDRQSNNIAEILLGDYLKLAYVDITTGKFEFLKKDMMMEEEGYENIVNIYDYIRKQVNDGMISSEHTEEYRRFSVKEYVCKRVFSGERRIVLSYKRSTTDGDIWVTFGIVSPPDCSPEKPYAVFSWREADADVRMLHEEREELVDTCYRDALTFLYNRRQFNADLEAMHKKREHKLTCLYVDVNGLHELNNILGHKKGDDMLCCVADTMRRYFPDEKVYRIGGDEFVMLSEKLSDVSTEDIVTFVRRDLMKDNYRISAGIESGSSDISVYQIVGAAELKMRSDKEEYYRMNGGDRHRREMNEELEKFIVEKNDAEYFLRLIATKYAGVYFVDLKRDTLRHIYIPQYFLDLLEATDFSYSKAMRVYMEKYVLEKYHPQFLELLDYDKLAKKLKQDDSVNMNYQKTDNRYMNLRILETDKRVDESHETIWVFSEL